MIGAAWLHASALAGQMLWSMQLRAASSRVACGAADVPRVSGPSDAAAHVPDMPAASIPA